LTVTTVTAKLHGPSGLFVDEKNRRLLMADGKNNCIRAYSLADNQLTTIIGAATQEGCSDGSCSSVRLNAPNAVAVDPTDPNGIVYVGDTNNHRILACDENINTATTAFGSTTGIWGYADGHGTAARLARPIALVFNSQGAMYIAERDRIRRARPSASAANANEMRTFEVSTVAGDGIVANRDGPLLLSSLKYPRGIALDPRNETTLFVACHDTIRIADLATGSFALPSPPRVLWYRPACLHVMAGRLSTLTPSPAIGGFDPDRLLLEPRSGLLFATSSSLTAHAVFAIRPSGAVRLPFFPISTVV